MRVWDLPPAQLCRQHLLAQHNEIHTIWSVITNSRRGYASHPETNRWRGRLRALYQRHESTVQEMTRRAYAHRSPLPESAATGDAEQPVYVDTPERQRELLRARHCDCQIT